MPSETLVCPTCFHAFPEAPKPAAQTHICAWDSSQWPCFNESSKGDPNPKDSAGRIKAPLRFIPPVALLAESLAMEDGAVKYGPFNWRLSSVFMSIYTEAALRHIYAFYDGQDFDSVSKVHHLGHARANLGIILDAQACGTGIDDRPPPGQFSRELKILSQNRESSSCQR